MTFHYTKIKLKCLLVYSDVDYAELFMVIIIKHWIRFRGGFYGGMGQIARSLLFLWLLILLFCLIQSQKFCNVINQILANKRAGCHLVQIVIKFRTTICRFESSYSVESLPSGYTSLSFMFNILNGLQMKIQINYKRRTYKSLSPH